jgi:hypothetical protein
LDLSVLAPNDPQVDGSTANSIQVLGGNICVAGETYHATDGTYGEMYKPVPCYWLNGIRTDLSVGREHMLGYGRSIFLTGK